MNRRQFLKNSMVAVAGTGLFGGVYAWQIEPFWLEFVHVDMHIENLPESLVGKTLMQISDIHVGKRFNPQYLIDSFKKATSFTPDFVVYTGDYVTTYKHEVLYDRLQNVLDSMVHGKLGTLAILGNHDYGRNWRQPEVANRISNMLTDRKVTVLRNESAEIEGLNFIGFDDYWGTNFGPATIETHYLPTKASIVLCHNPDVCDLEVWHNYQGWILSGHTHGGQCKPSFLTAPMLPVKNKKYGAGKIDLTNNRTFYINRALGHLWQVRCNVRPEITIFRLSKSSVNIV